MNKTSDSNIDVGGLLRELHHRIEAKERLRISQSVMAGRLGISTRTYLEYLRGTNAPIGMRVMLDLLCMLDDNELAQIIKHWRAKTEANTQQKPETT